MYLSIVIPVYKAGEAVSRSVALLQDCLAKSGYDYEILLRDDGSGGNARAILEETARAHKNVRCFFNGDNQGIGRTLRALFSEARGDTVVYLDCDLPFGATIVPFLVEQMRRGDYDCVVASRYCGIPTTVRIARFFCSRLYYAFCRVLFAMPVKDIGSGSVAFKRAALQSRRLVSKGFAIHAEIFWRLSQNGCRIKECACATTAPVAPGTFRIRRHGLHAAWETARLYVQERG